MVKKGVKLYKIKYVKDGVNETQWSVGILAMGWDDAISYIRSQVGEMRVEERGGTFDCDTITPACFLPQAEKVKVVEKIVEKVVEVPADGDAEDGIKCPWCGKVYKTMKTFETHAKKAHDVTVG